MTDQQIEDVLQRAQALSAKIDIDFRKIAFEAIVNSLLMSSASGNTGHASAPTKSKRSSGSVAHKHPVTLGDRILSLRSDNFFAEQRGLNDVRDELKKSAWHHSMPAIGTAIAILVRRKELRREKVKKDQKTKWLYSNA
jgi:hypothetical protein